MPEQPNPPPLAEADIREVTLHWFTADTSEIPAEVIHWFRPPCAAWGVAGCTPEGGAGDGTPATREEVRR